MSQENGQSVQSDVTDAVVAIIGSSATLAGGNAFDCRLMPFSPAELPAENVEPDQEDTEYLTSDDIELKFRFKIVHLAAAPTFVRKAVDLRHVRSQKLLFADPTLGGLVKTTRYLGRKWSFEDAAREIVSMAATYEVEFSTTRSDPSRPGF